MRRAALSSCLAPAGRRHRWFPALAAGAIACCCASADAENTADATINPTINPTIEAPAIEAEEDDAEADLPRVRIDLRSGSVDRVARRVLKELTLREKIGQLCQVAGAGETLSAELAEDIRRGRIGSLFYTGSVAQTREAQRVAREESRLGLPLLSPRDVIHGFRTVAPIPLAQASSWNPGLVERAARVAADEAMLHGVNWTFAPMLDISRDARWGRIAESLGEDPLLGSVLAEAMVRGFQQPAADGDDRPTYRGIAACAKHFAAYGLTEGGRDYNRVEASVSELHNGILPPFRAASDAGCATFMSGFNSINGVPATGHRGLLRGVLKRSWGFDGMVVSDWGSVVEMIDHGFAADRSDAARIALNAGVDMEMASTTFREHLRRLHDAGDVSSEAIDQAVLRVIRTKLRFALEDRSADAGLAAPAEESLAAARELARQGCVLLKNERGVLPLRAGSLRRVAVIGPLADAGRDQLGCWMLDGKPEEAVTPLAALREALGDSVEVVHAPGLTDSLDAKTDRIEAAADAARGADVAVVCVGEGWLLSGEARCRAGLDLPGAQAELVRAVAATGKPVVLVLLAGRPLTIGEQVAAADAVLYAWHPGTMGGPAIADLLLGVESPSGKLPVTFPKHVGQEPLYYNHPSTGRPALADTRALVGSGRADFPEEQKYRSHYLDVDPFPLFPFGFGLSYTRFEYGDPELSRSVVEPGQTLAVRVPLTNAGPVAAEEVAQLYVQDVSASIVRPVRELKAFRRVRLEPGETAVLEFALPTADLAFFDNRARETLEPGEFRLGVGGDSSVPLDATFTLRKAAIAAENTTAAPPRR